jgi:MYXO-CTERM domain-containing protein
MAVALGAAGIFVPAVARAHFALQAPPSATEQSGLGDPQKEPPCGGPPAVPTNMVTAFSSGDMVTVTVTETIFHPGHYRVALSTTGPGGLPADPPVTASASDPCASTVIQNPPVFPVLADGMLPHTSEFSGPQSFSFRLPAGMTCASNCTLQVIQYMSAHGAPCFYHHCANVTIQAGGGTGGTGGGTGGGTAGAGGATGTGGGGGTGESDSGCGCAAGGTRASLLGLLTMLAVAVVVARRRYPR